MAACAGVLVLVETGDAARHTKTEPSDSNKQSNKEKNEHGAPNLQSNRALALGETAVAAKLALSLERICR